MSIHRTHPPAPAHGDAAEAARVAAELRALGEPELEPELTLADVAAPAPHAAVFAAFALAFPADGAHGEPLDEITARRAWHKVAARVAAPARVVADAPTSRRRHVRTGWLAVATAAGLALVPMLGPELRRSAHDPAARASATALGAEARTALELVPGTQDQARAREYASRYADRLHGGGAVQ
jgi:hypothetical protein